MKNLFKTLAVLTLIIIVSQSSSFASGKSEKKEIKPAAAATSGMIAEEVSSKIIYPPFSKEEWSDEVVLVEISVDENGKVKVLNSNASSEKFNDYVVEKLNSMTLDNLRSDAEKTYNLRINFKLL